VTPAPISAEALAPTLAPFGSSYLLPRAAYVDPEILAWEKKNFFGDWVCLGRSADVADVGAQRAVSVGESGVLLLRGVDGVLRGFVNACRHRGHELLACGTSTNRRSVVCPYHAWNYKLDGELRAAPGFDAEEFDKSGLGLIELPVREWHGWIFGAPSGKSSDFDQHIGSLEPIIAPYAPESLRVVERHEYVVEANWKVITENYQECYHCSMIHPELCRVSPPESGENITPDVGDWVGGWMDLRADADTMSMDGASSTVAIATLSERELRTVMYLAVFPNLLISLHPDYVMTHIMTPLAPNKTLVECTWAFPVPAIEQEGFDPSNAVSFWDLTNRQDWEACESVQRGLSAEQYVPGPLAPDEDGVYGFVTLVARHYLQQADA
jgi:Rieske 2Fe-2S family protein